MEVKIKNKSERKNIVFVQLVFVFAFCLMLLPLDQLSFLAGMAHADSNDMVDYSNETGPVNEPVTPLAGIRSKLGKSVKVEYVNYTLDNFVVIPSRNVRNPDDRSKNG